MTLKNSGPLLFVALFFPLMAVAKSKVPAKPLPASKSYEILLNCFPELADEQLRAKVDLTNLKDLADERYVTSQSLLERRKLTYLDPSNRLMVLTLRNTPERAGKVNSDLNLQQKDEKGVLTTHQLTTNQKKSPPQNIINDLLLNSAVQEDEKSFIDTKLNGVRASYRLLGKNLIEYELADGLKKRTLLCEAQEDLGIICTCSKK